MAASEDNAARELPPRLELLMEQATQRTLTAGEFDELRSLIDDLFGLSALMKKYPDGPFTDQERAVHEAWMWASAGREFTECPVCGGAFAFTRFFVDNPTVCPCCGIKVSRIAIDPIPHSPREIHESLPQEDWGGAFTGINYAQGTHACPTCGRIYPQSYSCCPGLLARAIDLCDRREEEKLPNARALAKSFLAKHRDVLLNALRGAFGRTLDKQRLDLLAKIAPELTCGDELAEILSDLG